MASKSASSKKTQAHKDKAKNYSIIFYILLILLFYPPFFRGLFFQDELLPTHIFTAVISLAYFISAKPIKNNHRYNRLEILLGLLVITYIISTVFAVNTNLSKQETLKYVNYFLVLLLSKRLIDNNKKLLPALYTIAGASVIVVLIGMGTALGTFQYYSAFVDGMMNSTFQYHNTFGAYCLAMLFLVYALKAEAAGRRKYLINAASSILFLGFILSYSRGAWILLPPVGLLYYLLVPVNFKVSFFSGLIGNLIALIAVIRPLNTAIGLQNQTTGWSWILIGIAITILFELLLEKLVSKINFKEKLFRVYVPITALVIPVIGFTFKNKLLKFLPADLAQRLSSISLGTETVTERAVFYKDALKIFKDYPIFGAGGGGWETLYRYYQSYGYNSTQSHNYFMQLLVEVGTVGIIIFGIIVLTYAFYSFKSYRLCSEPSQKGILTGIFAAVMTILLHSAIDFDLSLSAIAIIMWSLIGMQMSMIDTEKDGKVSTGKPVSYGVIGLTIVLLFVSTASFAASNSSKNGVTAAQRNQDIENGMKSVQLAANLDPFNTFHLVNYASLLNTYGLQTKNTEELEKSITVMDRAVELEPYNYELLTFAGSFYMRNKEIDKVIDTVKKLEQNNPLLSMTYENKAALYIAVADYYIKEGKKSEALPLLKEIIDIEQVAQKHNDEIRNNVEITIMVKFVDITPKTQEYIDKAKVLLDELE